MITPTQQIVCSIVSRHLIADLSPTSHQRVADQSQPISNQLAINRPPVADRSPTGRRFLGIVVANQSPIDLQPKKMQFWSHSGCIGCSRFSVARQSATSCSACVTGALQVGRFAPRYSTRGRSLCERLVISASGFFTPRGYCCFQGAFCLIRATVFSFFVRIDFIKYTNISRITLTDMHLNRIY